MVKEIWLIRKMRCKKKKGIATIAEMTFFGPASSVYIKHVAPSNRKANILQALQVQFGWDSLKLLKVLCKPISTDLQVC